MADVIKKATRDGYGEAIWLSSWTNIPNLVVLDADLAAATKSGMFKKAHPERFYRLRDRRGEHDGRRRWACCRPECSRSPASFAMFCYGPRLSSRCAIRSAIRT